MISCLSGRPRPFRGLPQLCCTSPLRVYSWQSTLVFSLGFNPRCLSHRTQLPLTAVGVQIISQLWSAGWNWFLWWILHFALWAPVTVFPSEIPSSASLFSPVREFLSEQKCFLLHSSLPEVQVPVPNPLFFFFFLIFFAILHTVEISLPFGKSGSFCQHLEDVL